MTSAADLDFAHSFALVVARAAADPGDAAGLRNALRASGKKKRSADLVFAPGDQGVLLLGGSPVESEDEPLTVACALLSARLAAYGVEELTLTPKAADADLYELVRLLAAEPTGDDAASQFASRSAAVDSRSIPRRLRPRAAAPEASVEETQPPAAPKRELPKRASAPTPATSRTPVSNPVVATNGAPASPAASDTRSDELTEALEIPTTSDTALTAFFDRMQAAETPEALEAPLDDLAAWIDLAFRTGRHDALVEAMAGLIAIEHAQVASDSSDERRRAFAKTLRQLAQPLLLRQLAILRHRRANDAQLARRTQAVLYRYGTDGAEAMIDEYVSASTPEARQACLDALRGLRRTHDALFALVRDTRDLVVRQAAGLLGELGDERGEQMLIELLRHPDSRARRSAVAALGRFSTTTALEGTGLALDDESPNVRARAVSSLVDRGGPRAVALLTPLLDSESDREVLYAAVAALGVIGGADAVAALIRCAQGETEHPLKRTAAYRIAACTALVAIRSPQSMACVQGLREDRDRDVRAAAVRLVAQAVRRTVAVRAVAAP